ncbi:hypothetical protein ACTMU2_41310 [Cupriavidus basilensis]
MKSDQDRLEPHHPRCRHHDGMKGLEHGMGDYLGLVCSRWCHWSELALQRIERRPLAAGQVRIRVRHAGVGLR